MAGRYRKGAGVGSLVFGFGGKDYGMANLYREGYSEAPVGAYYRSEKFKSSPIASTRSSVVGSS